jgi:hypothetical protein
VPASPAVVRVSVDVVVDGFTTVSRQNIERSIGPVSDLTDLAQVATLAARLAEITDEAHGRAQDDLQAFHARLRPAESGLGEITPATVQASTGPDNDPDAPIPAPAGPDERTAESEFDLGAQH